MLQGLLIPAVLTLVHPATSAGPLFKSRTEEVYVADINSYSFLDVLAEKNDNTEIKEDNPKTIAQLLSNSVMAKITVVSVMNILILHFAVLGIS